MYGKHWLLPFLMKSLHFNLNCILLPSVNEFENALPVSWCGGGVIQKDDPESSSKVFRMLVCVCVCVCVCVSQVVSKGNDPHRNLTFSTLVLATCVLWFHKVPRGSLVFMSAVLCGTNGHVSPTPVVLPKSNENNCAQVCQGSSVHFT